MVEKYVDEARPSRLPVNGDTTKQFGMKGKAEILSLVFLQRTYVPRRRRLRRVISGTPTPLAAVI